MWVRVLTNKNDCDIGPFSTICEYQECSTKFVMIIMNLNCTFLVARMPYLVASVTSINNAINCRHYYAQLHLKVCSMTTNIPGLVASQKPVMCHQVLVPVILSTGKSSWAASPDLNAGSAISGDMKNSFT